MEHRNIPKNEIHAPHNWVVEDEAARLALEVSALDVGKYALQTDDNSEWMLTAISPAAWNERGAKGDTGPQGEQGAPGEQGPQGHVGPAGSIAPSKYAAIGERAKNKANVLNSAYQQAPIWATGVSVQPTTIVRLSTGELLVATQAAAGTTGATEPVLAPGYSPAAITDGGVTWWPLSAMSKAPSSIIEPVTYTDNAGNSSLTLYGLITHASQFDQSSCPNSYEVPASGTPPQIQAWAFADGSNGTGFGGTNGRTGLYRTVAFASNSDLIDVGYISTVANSLNQRISIEVDGCSVTEVPIIPGSIGGSRYIRLSIPGGRRNRIVRVITLGNTSLKYIGIPAACTVEKPRLRPLTALVATDSFGNTETPSVALSQIELAPSVSRRLGYPNCIFVGSGGTSYSHTESVSGRKSLEIVMSINDFAASIPDAWIFGHGYNAAGASVPDATESAAAVVCWAGAREISPEAPIIAIGPWYRSPSFPTQVDDIMAGLKAAFLDMADPNSAFIDPVDGSVTLGTGEVLVQPSGAWLNTTIASWAIPPVGGGFDGAHVSIAGKAYLEDCIVGATEVALTALGY